MMSKLILHRLFVILAASKYCFTPRLHLVQDLDSVLKGNTYLLSQKWIGVNSVMHPMSLGIHSVLSLEWEADWTSDDEMPSPMQI
ncbi:hypothetical protein E5676_scaffold109G00090 [Cucumis melo var. makuwa]|uniref:Uncharacterized protein n=1 Tax=Cucumis melo var. makuwa TaxID=1194695 RepID=A0A5D3BQ08_CUCMM|nr:hypothetical protein E6C27_scaffold83G00020 [Cucumis melo var. makuwa]TYK01140.1 hypothetical protein E5676_scaffold109G00090 [Cucumis melo var. makuwa]